MSLDRKIKRGSPEFNEEMRDDLVREHVLMSVYLFSYSVSTVSENITLLIQLCTFYLTETNPVFFRTENRWWRQGSL